MYFRVMLSVFSMLLYAGIVNAAPFAYIANNADNTVSVLDTASNQVTAVLPVGQSPSGVAVNRMGSRVYVSNQGDNTISVIDTLDNSVTSIPLAIQPGALAVNTAGTRLFVANPVDNSVSIFNAVDKSLLTTVAIPQSGGINCQPQGIAIGPGASYKAYVTCSGTTEIAVINASDPSSYSLSTRVSVPYDGPRGIAISADGKKVFVASIMNSTLTVFDTQNLSTANSLSVTVGLTPWGVAIDPTVADSANTTRLYVTDMTNSQVSTVDASGSGVGTMTVVAPAINVGTMPSGIAFTADGLKAITANYNQNQLGTASIILKANNTVTTVDGNSAAGRIGAGPYSFGNFAGPAFVAINTGVDNYFCGSVTTSELITPSSNVNINNGNPVYQVAKGQNVTFNVNALANCAISTVTVDGSTVTAPYTFIAPTADHNIYATFTRSAYIIEVTKSGTGTGTVVSTIYSGGSYVSGGGINCGTSCSASNSTGARIRLTPTATSGSTFDGWLGACSTAGPVCDLTLDQATAGQKGAENGTFAVGAKFRTNGSGPVRTNRGGTIQYKQTLSDAYTAISGATAANPIDLDTSKEYFPGTNCTFGSNTAITVVGGWTEYTTGGVGTVPAGSASIINPALCTTNIGTVIVANGSVTIGSYNNNGAIVIK
ncbi:putative protein [Geobacter sp. OR-1]|uniref:beta-propeller fold lactonase family protein n=1 Tax=Geobacter sp. OR-1 TaxID=1266765 RepID=UPI000541D410|nr:beta-propeller fold lactonase family protein [Geobacter sp. OR-1]GAM08933.1 putative protein [Geobacter sp. OR-1]